VSYLTYLGRITELFFKPAAVTPSNLRYTGLNRLLSP
jgi:hypothetical protein